MEIAWRTLPEVLTRAHFNTSKLYKSIIYMLLCAAVELEGVCMCGFSSLGCSKKV